MVRKFLVPAIAFAAMTGVAWAADLPNTKGPPAFAPPPPPQFTWTGLYAGAQIGYAWGQSDPDWYTAGGVLIAVEPIYHDEGIIGGGHLGYNWQISQFVFGIEGDINGSSYSGSGLTTTGTHRLATRIPFDGSIRGRLGYAWDRVLIYGTGGVAFGSIFNSVTTVATGVSDSAYFGRVGWTAGGGIEYAIDPNWSVGVEYRYTDFGSVNLLDANTGAGVAFLPAAAGSHNISRETENRVVAEVSYKFDLFAPPLPVVAKY
jgi:outer membrane immunogenic protein